MFYASYDWRFFVLVGKFEQINHLSCAVKLLLKDILRQYRVRDIALI